MQVPQQLIESVRRGEPGAFEELVRSTHRPVYSLVYRIVGNAEDAADVTQDVYLRVWRGLRGFRGDANFSTWLYRVAANAALTYVKRRARGGVPTEPSELPDLPASDGTEERADAELLEQALDGFGQAGRPTAREPDGPVAEFLELSGRRGHLRTILSQRATPDAD